ncbi:glutamate-rich protein 5 isoform X2 [Phyllobates terribilis]|uniref:glutamate-rich protein 5 isoform X2 n=1 Tax=Phyllobates terribilis TaxID=111132 RepID=UPI003CCB1E5F
MTHAQWSCPACPVLCVQLLAGLVCSLLLFIWQPLCASKHRSAERGQNYCPRGSCSASCGFSGVLPHLMLDVTSAAGAATCLSNPAGAGGAMGCSSSTLTHPQGSNRPPAKSVQTNGPKKSASSEVSDQIIDDIETIPDQTKLVPLTENEPSSNGFPQEDEPTEAEAAVELDEEGTTEPAAEDCRACCPPTEEEPVQMEKSTDLIMSQDNSVVEGEIEEAVEAKMQEEAVSEGPETKEDETGHPVDEAEPEMGTLIGE